MRARARHLRKTIDQMVLISLIEEYRVSVC